jgi:hypothetical protein
VNIEDLEYPWRKDMKKYDDHIFRLEQEISNLRADRDNLRYFCQQLYDRLNLSQPNYSSQMINKP